MPKTPCSRQSDNMPKSPCLGFCLLHDPPSLGRVVLLGSCPSHTNQPIQSLHPFIRLSLSGSLFTSPNHPGLGSRQQEIAPMPESPPKLFKLASPKPAYPSSPIPSHKTTTKSLDIFPSCPIL